MARTVPGNEAITGAAGFLEEEMLDFPETTIKPMRLEWKNLCCISLNKKVEYNLLNDVSGTASPGEILGIMGPSGSGKTTLLNILAAREIGTAHKTTITGELFANNYPVNSFKYTQHIAYVTQADILLPHATPRECLMFSLNLRTTLTLDEKEQRVTEMLKMLRLDHVADNRIGGILHKGLSGGERRRLCLGVELIVRPSVLLLDEPTSGLDSYTANLVLNILKESTQQGMTVIMTIHQPGIKIFSKLDKLILMTHGEFIYQGAASKALEHIEGLGYHCSEHIDPPDFFMSLLHISDKRNLTEEESQVILKLKNAYKAHDDEHHINTKENIITTISRPSAFTRFKFLTIRAFQSNFRNELAVGVKVMQTITIALLLTAIYYDLDDDFTSYQARSGLLWFISADELFMSNQNAILTCKNLRSCLGQSVVRERVATRAVFPYSFSHCINAQQFIIRTAFADHFMLDCVLVNWVEH